MNHQSKTQTVAFTKDARAAQTSRLSEARTNQLKAEAEIATITKTIAAIDTLTELWLSALEREQDLLDRISAMGQDDK